MQWIKCSDRLPTGTDGDADFLVLVRSIHGGDVLVDVAQFDELTPDDDIEWLAGACKREGDECNH